MNTKKLTFNAMFAAIIIVMSVVPFLGFIQVGPTAITITHIPVIIGAILLGPSSGAFLGFIFGLGSLYAALTRGATPIDALFINPLISVLPRVIFGYVSGLIWSLIGKNGLKVPTVASMGITAFLSTMFHSVLVITAIYLGIYFSSNVDLLAVISDGFLVFIKAAVAINVIIEAVLAVLVAVPVLTALRVNKS